MFYLIIIILIVLIIGFDIFVEYSMDKKFEKKAKISRDKMIKDAFDRAHPFVSNITIKSSLINKRSDKV